MLQSLRSVSSYQVRQVSTSVDIDANQSKFPEVFKFIALFLSC